MSDENTNENLGPDNDQDIMPISITDEMSRSYLDYAMSVIVSRALPDVRDGLKPVHRRILYSMYENGYDWNKPYRKSARVVGDVIGKYHPHGDQSIYDALVRMAQDFSLRLPLLDGQGNFGSVDGDPPAAMRYTEIRLAKPAHNLLTDLDKDTVNFQENYDNSETEPTVMPAEFPNLLVNGAGGIAVGMATNIPPHNLGEVIDATTALLANPELEFEDLLQYIHGPDFPTGGIILGRGGLRSAFATGRGSVAIRARANVEEIRKDRYAIVVTEIPYQVNKSNLVEKIAELVREKRVEGISDIRDESNREGMRIVIELKRDAVADVVLNQLYRFSPLQTSFGVNMVALNGGRPQQLNLKDILTAFIAFREEVVTRRTKYLLNKARERAHILVGLAVAVANIDKVIHIIRSSPDPATARERLMAEHFEASEIMPLIDLIKDHRDTIHDDGTYSLSEMQTRAILDLRLQRLTALGRDEISDELNKLAEQIKDYLDILSSRIRVRNIIEGELLSIREEFATPRKTEITESDADFEDEDLIQREDMVVTVSHSGYVKRVPLSTYRAQRRGGKGRSGMSTRDEDFVTSLFVANTHTPVLFFSSRGIVYRMKVWRLPLAAPNSRGKALVNLLPLESEERITTILPTPEPQEVELNADGEVVEEKQAQYLIFATKGGGVRRNSMADFENINRNGKIAMKFEDEMDSLAGVSLATEHDDIMLTTAKGQSIRFPVTDVRVFSGRTSTGIRGIRLGTDDHVISMSILRHVAATPDERTLYLKQASAMRRALGDEEAINEDVEAEAISPDTSLSEEKYALMGASEQFVLTISENGFGKRSSAYEYRVSGRGGKGITAMKVSDRNGDLVASFPVEDDDQLMLVSDSGQLIRVPVEQIRIGGRATQGVTVFKTGHEEKVVSVERISEADDEDDASDNQEELDI